VGDTHVVTISPPGEGGGGTTSATMKDGKLNWDTGAGASISMEGSTIKLRAAEIILWGVSDVNVTSLGTATVSSTGDLTLTSTGANVNISAAAEVDVKGSIVDVHGNPIKLNC
jgi:type VI secretion system secreted protein VgrG